MLIQCDDAPGPFRWSLRNSIVLCCGAFMSAPQDRLLTPTDLINVGLSHELVHRMGTLYTLPVPSQTMRFGLARGALHDVESFAFSLGVTVTGIDAYVATLAAPGVSDEYIGVRGLMGSAT